MLGVIIYLNLDLNEIIQNQQIIKQEIFVFYYKLGYKPKDISKIYPLSNVDVEKAAYNIRNGHCWSHLSQEYNFDNIARSSTTINNKIQFPIEFY